MQRGGLHKGRIQEDLKGVIKIRNIKGMLGQIIKRIDWDINEIKRNIKK
jgi:hypothetical protein